MPTYQLLTDRVLANQTAITPTTLIHIVTTDDISQNPAGSSYKAELAQLSSLFSFTGGTVTGSTYFTNGLTANTFSATTYENLPVSGLTEGSNVNISGSNGNYTISFTGSTGGSSYTYEIGEYVPSRGGIVFHRYLDGGNEHYLVVDTTDISSSSVWSNIDSVGIGSAAQSTWDGLSNSNAIVSQVGFTSGAAKLCLDSTNNGQTDWYLPAIDELSLLWQNRFNVNRTLSGNSSYGTISGAVQIEYGNYWSSTEFVANRSFFFGFSSSNSAFKYSTYWVRAVRKFSL